MHPIVFSAKALFYEDQHQILRFIPRADGLLRALIERGYWDIKIAVTGPDAEIKKLQFYALLEAEKLTKISLDDILSSDTMSLFALVQTHYPEKHPRVVYCSDDAAEKALCLCSFTDILPVFPIRAQLGGDAYHEVRACCVSSKNICDELWQATPSMSSPPSPLSHHRPLSHHCMFPAKRVAVGLGGGLLPAAGLTFCAVLLLTAANPPAGATVAAAILLAVAFACLGFGIYTLIKAFQEPVGEKSSSHAPSCLF